MPKPKKQAQVEEDLELEDEEDEDDEVEEDDDEDVEEATEDEGEDEDEEEDEKPAKSKKKSTKGKGASSGLVPREPVVVPSSVFKKQSPEIQKLLKMRDKLQASGDKKGLRKLRAELRKKGFKLSSLSEAQASSE